MRHETLHVDSQTWDIEALAGNSSTWGNKSSLTSIGKEGWQNCAARVSSAINVGHLLLTVFLIILRERENVIGEPKLKPGTDSRLKTGMKRKPITVSVNCFRILSVLAQFWTVVFWDRGFPSKSRWTALKIYLGFSEQPCTCCSFFGSKNNPERQETRGERCFKLSKKYGVLGISFEMYFWQTDFDFFCYYIGTVLNTTRSLLYYVKTDWNSL